MLFADGSHQNKILFIGTRGVTQFIFFVIFVTECLYFIHFFSARQNPDGVVKISKLQKLVSKSLEDSGIILDEAQLRDRLKHKVGRSDILSAS